MNKAGRTLPLFVSTGPAAPAVPGGGFLRTADGALIGAAASTNPNGTEEP